MLLKWSVAIDELTWARAPCNADRVLSLGWSQMRFVGCNSCSVALQAGYAVAEEREVEDWVTLAGHLGRNR